ncbi:MAG: GxxExxY protein [Planctomycetes bacterium]|nr:GxxExxY protein [Planctomycetota bacterium]
MDVPEEKIMADEFEVGMRMHRALGPGLFEFVYEEIFCHEMRKLGHEVKRQVDVAIEWDGLVFEKAFRIDVLVDDLVVCEMKSRAENKTVDFSQCKTHVVVSNKRLGAVMNFGLPLFKDGFKRVANGIPD